MIITSELIVSMVMCSHMLFQGSMCQGGFILLTPVPCLTLAPLFVLRCLLCSTIACSQRLEWLEGEGSFQLFMASIINLDLSFCPPLRAGLDLARFSAFAMYEGLPFFSYDNLPPVLPIECLLFPLTFEAFFSSQ